MTETITVMEIEELQTPAATNEAAQPADETRSRGQSQHTSLSKYNKDELDKAATAIQR